MLAVVILGSLGLSEWRNDVRGNDGASGDILRGGDGWIRLRNTVSGMANLKEAEALDVLLTATPSPAVPGVPRDSTPAPTREPGASPTLAPPEPRTIQPNVTETQAAFLRGYRDGGGDPAWEAHLVNVVIPCESGWRLDPLGIHLGPAQFARSTWETVAGVSGLWDYTNPYHVGYNVALWMATIAPHYGSWAGWPWCW